MRVHIAVLAALVLCCLVSSSIAQTTYKDWVWIDDFTVIGNPPFNFLSYDSSTDTLPLVGAAIYAADGTGNKILGGQRDNQITITAASEQALFSNSVSNSNFSVSTPFQAFGFTQLQYDGQDFSPNLNINGLGGSNGVDLTAGGNANQFHTIVASDIPSEIYVRIYSGSTIGGTLNDFCYYNFTLIGGNVFLEYLVDLSSFSITGLGCDFTRVKAIDVIIQQADAADSVISFLSTYGPIPSPSATISVTPSTTPSTTPSVSITSTPSPSSSETPTISETPSPSVTSTPSPSATVSETPSPSASSSVSPTPSASASVSETASPSITPTSSVTPTFSPSPTQSESVTPTTTPSISVTVSETPSLTVSKSVSRTASNTPPPSESPSPTPTRTPSWSPSPTTSQSITATPTRSVTASVTPTQSFSATPTKTPSITKSPSQTGSYTRTRSSSVSRSSANTNSPSVSRTISASISITRTPSFTASVTKSRTRTPSRTPSPTVGFQVPVYQTFCPPLVGAPTLDPTGRTGPISIDSAFLQAWQMTAPNGGCAHLATYSSEVEFSALYDSMVQAGATGGRASIIGGRRDTSSSSYFWGAGAIRGQAWVEPAINSEVARANCLQGFCLRDMSRVEPITDNTNQVGMALLIDDAGVSYLVPSSGAECFTVELNAFSLIPNSDGGQDFQFVSMLGDFDTHQMLANTNRQFLARVSGAVQNQWIKDELQCGTFNVWLGYETNPATLPNTNALRLSAGTGQGTVVLSGGQTTCNTYCNWPPGFTGIAAPGNDRAVLFDSVSGQWSVAPQATTNSALRAKEVCNAPSGSAVICTWSTQTSRWIPVTASSGAAAQQVLIGNAFYAGGGYSTTVGGVPTVFYFNCMCDTDSRVSLTCLRSTDPRSCSLYP